MPRKPPAGPHADVAERFAFLLDSMELDRDGFVAAVDGAVTARSLFAILAGDRRPSRSLAVLVERTFGFRADHLLHGTGAMWVEGPATDPRGGLTPSEERAVDFARRSVDNARLLDEELTRLEAWEAMWAQALRLLQDLERVAREVDASDYPDVATDVLERCWDMVDAFASWTDAKDRRRVVLLTRLFVRRFLVQVPTEIAGRGAMTRSAARDVKASGKELLARLDGDGNKLDEAIDVRHERVVELSGLQTTRRGHDLATQLSALVDRVDRRRSGLADPHRSIQQV